MNPPEKNDPLDSILKEQETYVEDGGFTAKVMTSLPKRKRGLALRVILLPGSVLLGLALAVWFLQGTEVPWFGQPESGIQLLPMLLGLIPLVVVAVALTWGIVAAFQW